MKAFRNQTVLRQEKNALSLSLPHPLSFSDELGGLCIARQDDHHPLVCALWIIMHSTRAEAANTTNDYDLFIHKGENCPANGPCQASLDQCICFDQERRWNLQRLEIRRKPLRGPSRKLFGMPATAEGVIAWSPKAMEGRANVVYLLSLDFPEVK